MEKKMRKILVATADDKEEILKLYKMQLGRQFCPWDEHYPDVKDIDFDLSRESLFVMWDYDDASDKEYDNADNNHRMSHCNSSDNVNNINEHNNISDKERNCVNTKQSRNLSGKNARIVAAISIDEDPMVEELDCWTDALKPGAELARLAVHPDWQNKGIAREMIRFAMEVLKKRGDRSVHFLVNRLNTKALRSYAALQFEKVGECSLYDQPFWCYEKKI